MQCQGDCPRNDAENNSEEYTCFFFHIEKLLCGIYINISYM